MNRFWQAVMVIAAAAAAYFAVFGGDYSLFEVWRLERQTERESTALDSARLDLERLQLQASALQSDSALERIAREQYGMIRPGERLYRFAEPRDSSGESEPAP